MGLCKFCGHEEHGTSECQHEVAVGYVCPCKGIPSTVLIARPKTKSEKEKEWEEIKEGVEYREIDGDTIEVRVSMSMQGGVTETVVVRSTIDCGIQVTKTIKGLTDNKGKKITRTLKI